MNKKPFENIRNKEYDVKNIESITDKYIEDFKNYSKKFDECRNFFKNHKYIFLKKEISLENLKSWKEKEKYFNRLNSNFNKRLEKTIKSLEETENDRKDYELKLLFNIQLAQMKSIRVQKRLQKHSIDRRVEEIEELERNLKKQEKNLKNIYIGFISLVSIFLGVFTLITGNINFFGNIVKNNSKNILSLFLIVNSVMMLSIITLIYFVYYCLKFFSETRETKFPIERFYVVPIMIGALGIFLIA